MPTLLQLFKHVKEQDDHPFLLEVIRTVVRERLAMPHAAVWWVMESYQRDTFKHDTPIAEAVRQAKATGVRRHRLYTDDCPDEVGYLLWYQFIDSQGEYDSDEFVMDTERAENKTTAYIRNRV